MAKPEQSKSHPDIRRVPGGVSSAIEGNRTVIRLTGDIDLVLMGELDTAARDAIALDLPVRVDVSEMTFMDSIGIGLLATLVRAGMRPLVVGASLRATDLIDLSGLRHAVDFS